MATVSINFKKGKNKYTQDALVDSIIQFNSSFVDISKYITGKENGVLISIRHAQTTSILNLTNTSPYLLLFFNENLKYMSTTYSIKSATGSFTVQTQYKKILILRASNNLKLKYIISLNI